MSTIEELEKIAEAQRKEANEIAEMLRDLTSRPGWPKLKELVEKQVQVRLTTVMTTSNEQLKLESAPTTIERLCGEANGLRLAMSLPETLLNAHEDMKYADSKVDQSDADE